MALGSGGAGSGGWAALRPGRLLLVWLPGLAWGLLWARLGLSALNAMEPVQRAFSAEVLQLLMLAAACWLGLSLASPPPKRPRRP